jgi:hypothetical protein
MKIRDSNSILLEHIASIILPIYLPFFFYLFFVKFYVSRATSTTRTVFRLNTNQNRAYEESY